MENQSNDECDSTNDDKQSILSLWLHQLSTPVNPYTVEPHVAFHTTRSLTPVDLVPLESCACAGCTYPHFEQDLKSIENLKERKRHWPGAGMDDSDTTISVSSSSRIITNRPILEPTPPSTKRTTRTPSPTRKLLTLLEQARPPLKCCQPGNAVGTLPERVVALRRYLARDLGKGCIPKELESQLLSTAPDEFEDIDPSIFSSTLTVDENLYAYWEKVQSVYIEAERCHNSHKDENAWVEVVRSLFRTAGLSAPTSILEVNSVQTQQITPDLLPILPNTLSPLAKKADLALAFSPDSSNNVRSTLDRISAAKPGTTFSHMNDAYTSTVPLVCGVEVKESGGDYNEAVMQLGIWSAAGLEKVRQLTGGLANPKTAGPRITTPKIPDTITDVTEAEALASEGAEAEPFLGWTVVGHEWRLHIAWKEPTGRVIVMGPWSVMKAGTASYVELFTLLQLVGRVEGWLKGIYWPWLRGLMVGEG